MNGVSQTSLALTYVRMVSQIAQVFVQGVTPRTRRTVLKSILALPCQPETVVRDIKTCTLSRLQGGKNSHDHHQTADSPAYSPPRPRSRASFVNQRNRCPLKFRRLCDRRNGLIHTASLVKVRCRSCAHSRCRAVERAFHNCFPA